MKSPCSPYNRYAMFRTLTSVGTAGLLLGEMLEALFSVVGVQKFMQDDPEGTIRRSYPH